MPEWLNRSRVWWVVGAVAAVLAVVVVTTAVRRPQRQPVPLPAAPQQPLDADLARRYAAEPVVNLFVHETGQYQRLPLEQYLIGVAAAEGTPNMPPQALQALVVAARTMTFFNLEDPQAPSRIYDHADVCTSPDHFQAYAPDKASDAVRQAVQATRGQALIDQGKFIYAVFSSYAGGRTANTQEAFGGVVPDKPYLQSVDSPLATMAPAEEQSWSVTVPKSQLLGAVGVTARSGTALPGVSIVSRGPSGRALQLRLGDKTITGIELRAILGGSRLRSTLITGIQDLGDRVTFSGRGWGHGAGLDQWGAHAMALQGSTVSQILSHYYAGAAVRKIYP